ncbi:hypothetical protein [Microbacterium sp. CH-015]|uniref:hypothetical protein n=1 Tax=Microbacterium sp. CH-015 TaxID=3406734 RepID=UPI003C732CB5
MNTRAEPRTTTQTAYPWKATLRTIVQVGVPAVITLVGVLPLIIQVVLDELGEQMPEGLRLWLLGAAALLTAVAAALARVMAIPAVNAWLTRLGLGATPK